MSARVSSVMSGSAITSETAKLPPGRRTRAASPQDPGFVAGKVDHAVGDHHVNRVVGEGYRFDLPLQEFDVLDTGFLLVAASEFEHLVGHVEAEGLAGRADPPGREQDVDAATGSEIENGLTFFEISDGSRISAAERGELYSFGQFASVAFFVEVRSEYRPLLFGDDRVIRAAGRIPGAGVNCRRRVPLARSPLSSDSMRSLPSWHPQPCSSPQHSSPASASQQGSLGLRGKIVVHLL